MRVLKQLESCGSLRRWRQTAGFTLFEAAFAPNACAPVHRHETARICVISEGGASEVGEHRRTELDRGTVIFWRPGATHADAFSMRANTTLHIDLSPERLAELDAVFPHDSWATPIDRLEVSLSTLRRQFDDDSKGSDLLVEGMVLELIGRAMRVRGGSVPPLFLQMAERYIRQHLTEAIGPADVADAVRVARRTLSEQFKQHFGLGISAFVRRLRLEEAARALRESDRTITEIASMLHFSDQSHLVREFKRMHGETPARFRQRNR